MVMVFVMERGEHLKVMLIIKVGVSIVVFHSTACWEGGFCDQLTNMKPLISVSVIQVFKNVAHIIYFAN